MIWQHDNWAEQKRILMDIEVMNSQHSPYIVGYYGSAIIKVVEGITLLINYYCIN